MILQEPLLVTIVKLVDAIPGQEPPKKRSRGRPKVYSDRLMVKALVITVVRRLYSTYSLLAFLEPVMNFGLDIVDSRHGTKSLSK